MPFLAILCSVAVSVSELPQPIAADMEVTTNVPVTVDFGDMSRLRFTLSVNASPTNALEVAVGTDENRDGRLAIEESDHVFGYDCGRWFVRDGKRDEMVEEYASEGRLERTFLIRRPRMNAAWNLVKVTRRGTAGVAGQVSVDGEKPGVAILLR